MHVLILKRVNVNKHLSGIYYIQTTKLTEPWNIKEYVSGA